MAANPVSPIERLRRVWSPGREVEEIVHNLDPQSELNSMILDFLHRVIEQTGPKTLLLGVGDQPIFNNGTLRWEVIHHEPQPGIGGRREVSLWVEK
jgi:hypothetical protein